MLSEAEVVQALTAVNQSEIDVGELAREKSQNELVRQFAEAIITDHTRLLEESQGTAGTTDTTAGTDTAAGAIPPGTQPPTTGTGTQGSAVIQQLEQQSQQAHSQLETLTGEEFDQAFIAQQVQAHQDVLDLIDQQLLPSTQDPQLRMQLESARPIIEQHLQQAQQIQQQLGTGAPGTPGATDTTGTGGTAGRTA
jgi:putative membrane protein